MNYEMRKNKIFDILQEIYSMDAPKIMSGINRLWDKYSSIRKDNEAESRLSERDSMLITYADMIYSEGECGLQTLQSMLHRYVKDNISAVHLLPFFPYSSDDGFSVIDYKEVRCEAGTWENVKELSGYYDLMFDAVINHISCKSKWFLEYMRGNELYKNYFIECDSDLDYSKTVRPRDLPLLTEFDTALGKKMVWTTFSSDQVDLNYREGMLLIDILDILLMYVSYGAKYIRLDAIGFLWKEIGTSCIHLWQTHALVKLMRLVLEYINNDIILITETNVPHEENISYFGKDHDEAHMVYQFPIPPLTIHAFLTRNSTVILNWLETLRHGEGSLFFNFLASHDGIGLRPLEGIISEDEISLIETIVIERGGQVSYRDNSDGTKSPYELNINYLDAICEPELDDDLRARKFLASQAVLLSVAGVPGIYLHSLIGSRNDIEGFRKSGIKRRINREKLDKDMLYAELDDSNSLRSKVLNGYLEMLRARKGNTAFSPDAEQKVIRIDPRLFSIERHNERTRARISIIINLTDCEIGITGGGINIINGVEIGEVYEVRPYEVIWLEKKKMGKNYWR